MKAKAQNQFSALLDTLRSIETRELARLDANGLSESDDLSNIQAAIDHTIDAHDALQLLVREPEFIR